MTLTWRRDPRPETRLEVELQAGFRSKIAAESEEHLVDQYALSVAAVNLQAVHFDELDR